MKIAILLLCHKNPKQINMLLDTMENEAIEFFIHVDKKADIIDQITHRKDIHFLPEEKAVMLKHSVGEGDRKVGPFHIRVGSPVREYYQTRDSQVLVRKKYVPFKMKLVLMKTIYIRPIVHKFFMPDWDTRRKYIERGKEDYKKHIKGEYIENHQA